MKTALAPLHITEKVLLKDGLLLTIFRKNNRREQKTFAASKLHKKMKRKNFLWILLTECSKNLFAPSFGNTMLYAVLSVRYVCKYAGEAVGNLFFFSGGKKREGKSSFADMGFGVGGAVCKCAFTVAVAYFYNYISDNSKILVDIINVLITR